MDVKNKGIETRDKLLLEFSELIKIRDIFWDKTKQSLIDFLEGTIFYDLLLENNY
tara:strand:+ start:269 stop:433 length:165 start_codon:yes stop_codon:yes gene_type:complete